MQQEKAGSGSSEHDQRVGNAATGGSIDSGLVREFNSGSEGGGVGGVDIGCDVGGRLDRVITGDVN